MESTWNLRYLLLSLGKRIVSPLKKKKKKKEKKYPRAQFQISTSITTIHKTHHTHLKSRPGKCCITCGGASAVRLLEGSQNLLTLCSFWRIWRCLSYRHFWCFSAEGQTEVKQTKNNQSVQQMNHIFCCIMSQIVKYMRDEILSPGSMQQQSSQAKKC